MPAELLTIAVGSKNPVKVEAARRAFAAAFADATLELFPYDVSSGVNDQPWSDSETREGAINRAHAAAAAHREYAGSSPTFSVGLEVTQTLFTISNIVAAAVIGSSRVIGIITTAH